jgi:hypothetical protein
MKEILPEEKEKGGPEAALFASRKTVEASRG